MRAVFDTNVVVSSFLSTHGAPATLRKAVERGRVELVVSRELLDEYRRALCYPKVARYHGMDNEMIERVVEGIRLLATEVGVNSISRIVPDDSDDDIVVAVALAGEASILVSGDEHLLRLERYEGIRILSPAAFHALLRSEHREEI